jgi:Na+/H+-dicarboxylate symporter
MFRSATNVLGNALATSVVGKWEDGKEMNFDAVDSNS